MAEISETGTHKMSVAVLCGGKSTRMGRDKAKLEINGETFLTRIIKNYARAGELFLSVEHENDYQELGLPRVVDVYSRCGPLAGLHAALQACKYPILFVTACDMPFVTLLVAQQLATFLTEETDAVIPVDKSGRKHVLCGLYRKRAEYLIGANLAKGERKVTEAIKDLRVCYVPLCHIKNGEKMLMNLNTPEEYGAAMGEKEIPVFSIVAYSGVGKTTFLEKLIPELKKRGLRVGVVKHDAHDFEIDKEGKDSYRITRAGADVTGLISGRCAVLMENRRVEPEEIIRNIRGVDVILTEGYKAGRWPKIMLHREGTGKQPPLSPATCLAVISDMEMEGCKNWFGLNDASGVADLIVRNTERGQN